MSTLNCTAYNILAQTAQKASFLCCCLIVAMRICFVCEALIQKGYCKSGYLVVIAQQWVYMSQYIFRCLVSMTCFLVVKLFFIHKIIFYVQTYLVVVCHLRFSDLVLR
jgi:hypothetical protein